jgi:hypothetical protein
VSRWIRGAAREWRAGGRGDDDATVIARNFVFRRKKMENGRTGFFYFLLHNDAFLLRLSFHSESESDDEVPSEEISASSLER